MQSIVPGGPAASLGLIVPDDELLSVNGEDVHFKQLAAVHDLIGYVENLKAHGTGYGQILYMGRVRVG